MEKEAPLRRTIVSVCMLGLLPGVLLAQEPELALEPVTLAADSLHGPVRSVEWRISIPGMGERVIRTWYDRQGRRTEREQVEDGVTMQRWRYSYDEKGRRSGMEVESRPPSAEAILQRYAFVYDAHDRVTAQLIHFAGAPEPTRHTYARDEHGRLVKVVYDRSGRTEYRYDTAGNRVVQAYFDATGREYGRHDVSYDAAGRVVERRVRSDELTWVVQYRYDAGGRLAETVTEVVAGDPAGMSHGPVPGREVYTWSNGGRTKETAFYAPDGTPRNRLVQRWDAKGRLVEWTENGRGTVRWEYEEDHWGNWTRQCHLWSPPGGAEVQSTCITRAIAYW